MSREHQQGCPVRGGYRHGEESCLCGAEVQGYLRCTACSTRVEHDDWTGACPNCGNGTMRECNAPEPNWKAKFEAAVQIEVPLGCERKPCLSRVCARGTACCGVKHSIKDRPADLSRLCPLCLGRGYVPAGFYTSMPDQSWSASSTTSEPCRMCAAKGYLLVPLPPAPPEKAST